MVIRETFVLQTPGRGSMEITARISAWVAKSGINTGLCHLFLPHTSASLMLCENADADVRRDLETFMAARVPDGWAEFVHTLEGPDDMPAHVRSVLTGVELSVPIGDGGILLGTWQGIYLWEHRLRPHRRQVVVTLFGE